MPRLTAEEYLSTGMDHAGYLEPEVTSGDTYPEYIRDEVERKIEELQKYQGYETATFGFITDIHYAAKFKYSHPIRLRRSLNAYREISRVAQSDYLILGGDHVTNGCKQYVADCYRALRWELDGITFLPVNGNHDENAIWDKEFMRSNIAENDLTPEERYALFYNGVVKNGAVLNNENRGLYYYVDNKNVKIRYIFLDSSDVPYVYEEDGVRKYPKPDYYGLSQAQVDWLVNKALWLEEEGWAVVVIMHVASYKRYREPERLRNLRIVHDVLRARKEAKDVHIEAGEGVLAVTADVKFSKYIPCEMVGVFAGHEHVDELVNEDGIWYCTTVNSVMYKPEDTLNREDGKASELAFDMVTIDRKKHRVSVLRIGAGENRVFEY